MTMVRIWTPIPSSAVQIIRNFFRGTIGWILWRLFVLIVGGFLLVGLVQATGGFLIPALAGMVISIALSSEIRAFLSDIWNARFYWVKL